MDKQIWEVYVDEEFMAEFPARESAQAFVDRMRAKGMSQRDTETRTRIQGFRVGAGNTLHPVEA